MRFRELDGLLLEVVLASDEAARRAWRRIAAEFPIEAFDYSSYRLLPRVIPRVLALEPEDPLRPMLLGIRRKTFFDTAQAVRALTQVVAVARSVQDSVALLKGAALTFGFYPDYSSRICSDMDVYVARKNAREIVEQLMAQGWRISPRSWTLEEGLLKQHAVALRKEDQEIDIHWHVLVDAPNDYVDGIFFEEAGIAHCAEYQVHVPALQSSFFHACISGMRESSRKAYRIADAIEIARALDWRFDWHALERLALEGNCRALYLDALATLGEQFDQPIPKEAVASLRARPPRLAERLGEFRDRLVERESPLHGAASRLHDIARLRDPAAPLLRQAATAAEYLRCLWGLPSLLALPLSVVRKVVRRLLKIRERTACRKLNLK